MNRGKKSEDVIRDSFESVAELKIVKFGKGPFVLLKCTSCGNEGWWGTSHPKFCVNCGRKFITEIYMSEEGKVKVY